MSAHGQSLAHHRREAVRRHQRERMIKDCTVPDGSVSKVQLRLYESRLSTPHKGALMEEQKAMVASHLPCCRREARGEDVPGCVCALKG